MLTAAGDYLIRVRGSQDMNQFYRLDISLSELPPAGTSADLNLDGSASGADWEIFLASAFVDLTGLSQKEAFQRGDLDLDGDNDEADFLYFKTAYNVANGAGAFAGLLHVPEPSVALLACFAAVGIGGVRIRSPERSTVP